MTAPTLSKSPLWLRALGVAGGVVLGAVLLVAAWAKTLDPAAFARQIEIEGLAFVLSPMTIALIALALEVFLGVALVLGARRRWLLVVTTLLVLFFLFLTGRAYVRDLRGIAPPGDAGCGCFGNLVERTPAEAFWQDLLLLVPALLLAWLGLDRGPRGPRVRLAIAAVVALATVGVAWKAPDLPFDDLATRLHPGIDPFELCAGSSEEGNRVCLDSLLPEIGLGDHVVVIADLDDAFGETVARLNEYHWAGGEPTLWVLTGASPDDLFTFQFAHGPVFEIREAPAALLRPLYRRLPRSFRVRDGLVVETFAGLPPLDEWTNEARGE